MSVQETIAKLTSENQSQVLYHVQDRIPVSLGEKKIGEILVRDILPKPKKSSV